MKNYIENLRPENKWAKYSKKLSKEIKNFFFLKKYKKINSKIFHKIKCPVCKEKKFKKYSTINFLKLVECSKCSLIYLNPRPTQKAQLEFFLKSKALDMYSTLVNESKNFRTKNIFVPLVKFLKKNLIKSKSTILEVGCGSGLLLDVLRKSSKDYKLCGIDINSKAVNISKKKDHNVIKGSFENYNFDQKFDLIIFWAVFDHFSDPDLIIKKCKKILKKKGAIIIGNLNIEGFESTILGKNNFNVFSVPERQNFFGIKSIKYLLNKNNFKNIAIETTGKLDVDLVKNYWDNNPNIHKDKFLYEIISNQSTRKNFQEFLIKNNLSSHMTIIAKK